jgi:cyclic pyranopterin phosphate synthase
MAIPQREYPADRLGRALASLRVSVTDRCNIRCRYCMPENDYVWLPRESILTFEEVDQLVAAFTSLGVTRVRITGGEPLLRHDLPQLISLLSGNGLLEDIAITTNGIMLAKYAQELKEAGLSRVTVSLDTLIPERFVEFTRSGRHADVLEGIDLLARLGFQHSKLNTVVIRGVNDDELTDLLAFGIEHGLEVRFIEYMDVGGATRWSMDQVVPRLEILTRISDRFGDVKPNASQQVAGGGPADLYELPDGTTFGIIASTTQPFCGSCDRSRITADGVWYRCLYAESGIDLKGPLRSGAPVSDLVELIRDGWLARSDQGAIERLALKDRHALYEIEGLRSDPHREMHTRGG